MTDPLSRPEHLPSPDDVDDCCAALRDALRANGITLPSLGVDLPGFAGTHPMPLVSLGRCNTKTALRLTEALFKAAVR
ncbi:hypothetical protein [Streptomyces benahoarensis]|uniref:hypothetical protein n=1 Tax=Streptomyces benahoarensis TaxID=2595054 RepID=UPI00203656C1|nr:hypothetical protein [Streptomyces benahoarensis]